MNNRLLEFITGIKEKEQNIPGIDIETLDYQSIIQKAITEEYRHPQQKDFIFKEIKEKKPMVGTKYSQLKDKSMEYLMMKYHLHDVKLKKGHDFRHTQLKRGDTVSILDKNFIKELPVEYQKMYLQSFDMGNIPFYFGGDIFTLSTEYFRKTV